MGSRDGDEQYTLSQQNDREILRYGIEHDKDFFVKPCPSPFNLCGGRFNQFRLETDDATGVSYYN